MKSSFPKRVKRQSKDRGYNVNAIFGNHVLEKCSSYICRYVFICLHVKNSFQKPKNQTWHWHCKVIFWNGAKRVFEKSSIWTYTSIHIHIHTYTHMQTCIEIYTHMDICSYAFRQIFLQAYIHMHICQYSRMHICTYICIHILNLHLYTYTYTYVHLHM